MKYYVSVGPGGVFFRAGMALTGMMGALVYWRASRRRGNVVRVVCNLPFDRPELAIRVPHTSSCIMAGSSGETGTGAAAIVR